MEDAYKNAKSEIEAPRLELENKDKTLLISMNENSTLKLSINEKIMQCSNEHSNLKIGNIGSMKILLAINVVWKVILHINVVLLSMALYCLKGFGFQKVPIFYLTTKDP